ncbi:MAG: discoidin domain-containing protein [Sedimentisphaerales bacterium]|nr:discoidin domain-containing protein [Sedimentisphaerales bacterium]
MLNKKCYIIIFSILLCIAGGIRAETLIIGSEADTWIQNDAATHGADPNMVLWGANTDYSGYVRFNLAANNLISVQDAILTFTVFNVPKPPYRNDTVVGGRFSLYGLSNVAGNTPQNWNEETLNEGNIGIEWSTNGGDPLINVVDLDDDVAGITETVTNGPGGGWDMGTTITITGEPLVSFLQSRIDDDGLVTFILCNNDGADRAYGLGTRENDNEDVRPRLELNAVIGAKTAATNPNPANGDDNVVRDVLLSWIPGVFAEKHDVFLGTDYNDVSQATPTIDPNGVYLGQVDTNFYPESGTYRLEFNETYYWRVDEVNGPPDYTPFTGKVWSFSTEPLSIMVAGGDITATASSQIEGEGPENTINGSGLDNNLHSAATSTMWVTPDGQTGPVWIQYEFDKPYKLHEMQVWNYNGQSILSMYGLKEVVVEYSIDGTNWGQVPGVNEFTKAPGTENYAGDITVPFNGVAAKFVRITATSNWSSGLFTQYGLSEVRFMYIPTNSAEPNPDDGAADVDINTTLSWRTGRGAEEHNLYISNDEQAVIGGTVSPATVNQNSYGPLSLDLGSTYYWRVDEVNSAEAYPVWEGGVWNFTTEEYLVVDDFESYNDIPQGEAGSNLVYLTWVDGYDNPSVNGSTMGYTSGSSVETGITHEGSRQSVPLMYNNSVASSSVVTVSVDDLGIGRDWTRGGATTLALWFYGDPNNATTEQMYMSIGSKKVPYTGEQSALTTAGWTAWTVDLTSLGINLNNVTTLSIGFERAGVTGGTGTIFIDNVRLYKIPPQ